MVSGTERAGMAAEPGSATQYDCPGIEELSTTRCRVRRAHCSGSRGWGQRALPDTFSPAAEGAGKGPELREVDG